MSASGKFHQKDHAEIVDALKTIKTLVCSLNDQMTMQMSHHNDVAPTFKWRYHKEADRDARRGDFSDYAESEYADHDEDEDVHSKYATSDHLGHDIAMALLKNDTNAINGLLEYVRKLSTHPPRRKHFRDRDLSPPRDKKGYSMRYYHKHSSTDRSGELEQLRKTVIDRDNRILELQQKIEKSTDVKKDMEELRYRIENQESLTKQLREEFIHLKRKNSPLSVTETAGRTVGTDHMVEKRCSYDRLSLKSFPGTMKNDEEKERDSSLTHFEHNETRRHSDDKHSAKNSVMSEQSEKKRCSFDDQSEKSVDHVTQPEDNEEKHNDTHDMATPSETRLPSTSSFPDINQSANNQMSTRSLLESLIKLKSRISDGNLESRAKGHV